MSCEQEVDVHADLLASEYINGLYGYAMVLTRNHTEAEDLVQETYVRAIPAMGRLRPDSNIKGWLFKILRNIWLNQIRKRRNSPLILQPDMEGGSVDDMVDPAKNSYEIYASKMEGGRVRAAIQELPLEFREVILLREFEELSYQEIASLLGCPQGTVMSRLARARSKLRILLSSTSTGREQARTSRRNVRLGP
jgi:RNA polymerase sigma-70 factor (ECF subfamily)